jgi:hypothetical protein
VPALCAVLVLAYLALYLAHPALPGNNPVHPLGWWGWWDQSQYVRSARALARGDFAPSEHWYPPAYALIGAPFARLWPAHPFILANLLCLLGTAWLFVAFAARLGVGPWMAALLFILGSVPVADAWVVPWTSSPTALCLWAVLLLAADHLQGRPRPWLLGLAASVAATLRPADAIVPVAVIGAVMLIDIWRLRGARRGAAAGLARRVGIIVLGGVVPVALLLALHLATHGWRLSPYMLVSRDIGFSLHAYGWKAFNLLVEPRAWWGDGIGLIRRAPWVGLALLLLPFAAQRGAAAGLLALGAFLHLALYIAYVDLLPTGLWRYHNIHYFKWSLPGFALLSWVGLVAASHAWRAARQGRRGAMLPALAVLPLALLLCARLMPERADAAAGTARALLLRDVRTGMHETYFGEGNAVSDRVGVARNVTDLRFFPAAAGTRVLWLRRDAALPITTVALPAAGVVPPGTVEAYQARLTVGWPCWLPPYVCKRGF